MSTPVDRSLLELYVLGELDDAQTAEVERLVAEDPAWADALVREAQLELAVFEVADAAGSPDGATEPESARVSWLDRLRAWLAPLLSPVPMGALVGAFAVLFVLLRAPSGDGQLPPYRLEMSAGEAVVRSAPEPGAGVPTFTRGSTLSMVVRPQTRVAGSPSVEVLLDGKPLTGTHLERLDGGTVEISGVFGQGLAEPAPGDHEVVVRVGAQELRHKFVWKAPVP